MNIKDENMEWEKEAPYLASLSRTSPYRVPDNYFNELGAYINQSVFLADLTKTENQGFTVPSNYFEDLGSQIEGRITSNKLSEMVGGDGFGLPENYFEKLQTEILNKTVLTVAPKTKVVRLWQSGLMKYVSAACFVVLAASGLYLNQQNTLTQARNTELANEQVLYDIDESVIIEHLQESQTATSTATDTEMENYILDNFSSSDLSNNL